MFASSFMYSPDSNYYIDMDSYGLEIAEGENNKLEYFGREVDIKVYLVKVSEADTFAFELMMCGTSCNPQEAVWENEYTIDILGVSENQVDEETYPTIWKFNLKTHSFTKYVSNQKVMDNIGSYFEEKRLGRILN
ncbi:hypothetical protein MY04_4119 [Flammeovirga sp. MY04]|uniref:hypothetical protein n=1 Tax=Flammeovirga sp. MY04 TaxID=1191459 RepID=UPI000806117B|nr:hypothetical protein [Flammeovirga sp. MY04]ANQ51463.1 hypothetical protein MY04_4119 [Flammeovirga sp. MY04]